ncbi:hypothetical protein HJG60_011820 [Phyllostomus discolor]|uniref:Uncharacterized protein n=1 Tax=Phyllostomus discolor TaxID=89673 RepID=A0A833ZKS6_9CHIR|nr:hypothetical protein HJG60_011820 [Phyllostomus discolor]
MPSISEDVEPLELLYTAGGSARWGDFRKLSDLAFPLLGVCPRETMLPSTRRRAPMVVEVLFAVKKLEKKNPRVFQQLNGQISCGIVFLFYLFIFRKKEGREKQKGININVWLPLVRPLPGTWPATQACALIGSWTSDPLVCRLELSSLGYTSQGCCIVLKWNTT